MTSREASVATLHRNEPGVMPGCNINCNASADRRARNDVEAYYRTRYRSRAEVKGARSPACRPPLPLGLCTTLSLFQDGDAYLRLMQGFWLEGVCMGRWGL